MFAPPLGEGKTYGSHTHYSSVAHVHYSLLRTDTSLRNTYLRRVLDILHLSLLRRDSERAQRAWSILVRCHELNLALPGWNEMSKEFAKDSTISMSKGVDALTDRVLAALQSGRIKDGLDDLELYITSHPYSENAALHVYAALMSLYLAQSAKLDTRQRSPSTELDSDMSTHRDAKQLPLVPLNGAFLASAQSYFQLAINLYKAQGQADDIGPAYIKQLRALLPGSVQKVNTGNDFVSNSNSDEDAYAKRMPMRGISPIPIDSSEESSSVVGV